MRRTLSFVLLVSILSSRAGAQEGPLDLIPADALAAIAVRSPDELRKKGDELVRETGLKLDFRFSDAVDQLANWLGVGPGLDFKGPAVLFALPEEEWKQPDFNRLLNTLVLTLAVEDRDKMAANFGYGKEEVPEGKVLPAKRKNGFFGAQFALRGQRVYLGNNRTVVESSLVAEPLRSRLSADQAEDFGKRDLLVHFNPRKVRSMWADFRKELTREFDKFGEDPQEKEAGQRFLDSLDHFRFVLAGARLAKGIDFRVFVGLDEKQAAVRAFLGGLRSRRSASLEGLPKGLLVAAQAHAGDETNHGLFARAFVHFFLRNVVETVRITANLDRPLALGVFQEVWRRIDAGRVGIYLTRDEAQRGLFAVVAILDVADSAKFTADLQLLARIGEGKLDLRGGEGKQTVDLGQLIEDLASKSYSTRAAATTKLRLIGEPALAHLEKAIAAQRNLETVLRARRLLEQISAQASRRRKELLDKNLLRTIRPTFSWYPRAETRKGVPVDVVRIQLQDADEATRKALQAYLGPDWDKMRLSIRGKKVVVLLGSETDLFDLALEGVDQPSATDAKEAGSGPVGRFRVSVEALASLIGGEPRRLPRDRLTDLTVSVPPGGIQVDLKVPGEELRLVARYLFR